MFFRWLKFSLICYIVLILPCRLVYANETNFTILHTSDEHSALMPAPLGDYLPGQASPALGGFARIATLVQKIRKQKCEEPVLLFSSGDFIGGNPFAWLTLSGKTPEIDIMRRIGYIATTFGNHEFDYGPETIAGYLIRGNSEPGAVAVLSSNMVIPPGHPFNNLPIKSHILLPLPEGPKIGVFALLGKGAHRVSPSAKPLDFADQHDSARREVADLKAAGADIIIVLSHSGISEDCSLAEAVSGIDLILGGHDHLSTDPPHQVKDTIIMHSGSYLQTIGHLDLAFNSATGKLRLRNSDSATPFIHEIDHRITEDPVIASLTEGFIKELNRFVSDYTNGTFTDMRQTVARSDFPLIKHQPLCETTVGNFIADAMRIEAEVVTGDKVDFAIHANGIIRGNITPGTATQSHGNIAFMDLVATSDLGSGSDGKPGYPLVSIYLTEAEVLNALEIAALLPVLWGDIFFLQFSGLRYVYDPARVFWLRIPFLNKPLPAYCSVLTAEKFTGDGIQDDHSYTKLQIGGTKLYHLVTTHYLATYLPMVGQKLPRLTVVPKDKQGNPIALDQAIIRLNNRELKLWEAVVRYSQSFATASSRIGVIPDYYRQTASRIVIGHGTSLWLWPGIAAFVIAGVLLMILRKRCKKS